MFYDTDFLRDEEIFLKLTRTAEGNPEKQWVPAYYFAICLNDGTEVGTCDFRIGHNERLYYGGNIGYAVDGPYRGHHYAGKACKLLFRLAQKHGMNHLYITCMPENLPSAMTCAWVGEVLEGIRALPEDHDLYQRGERHVCVYRVNL